MSRKRDFPTQEQLADFATWYDNLTPHQQEDIDCIPDCIDILPEFCREWTLNELWSSLRDYLGV